MKTRTLTALLCAVVFSFSLCTSTTPALGAEPGALALGAAIEGEPDESCGLTRSVAGGTGNPLHTPVTIVEDGYVNSSQQVVLKKNGLNNDFTGQAKTVEQVRTELERLLASHGASSLARSWSGTNPLQLKPQTHNADGSLSAASKQQLVDAINFQRFCSGSGPITLDAGYKEQAAQAGADYLRDKHVIGSGANPHYAADGSGNDLAAAGLRTSNLAAAYRQSTPTFDYNVLLENLFHDDDTSTNFKAMGHRRWLLNNALSSIGIGYTAPTKSNPYTHLVTYIDGRFGGDGTLEAYPANGAYPVELMNFKGWTVSLGRNEKFNFDNMTFKVTARFPGQTEQPVEAYLHRVQSPDAAFGSTEKNWFGLTSGNCGSGQTILFEPSFIFENSDYTKTDSLIGTTLEIELDGITWNYGSWGTAARTDYPVAPVRYSVEFFSATGKPNSSWRPDGTIVPTYTPAPTPVPAQYPAPELLIYPSNPKVGDQVSVYCTNYDELGLGYDAHLWWQYVDKNGNYQPLHTSGLSTASFALTPECIPSVASMSRLDICASVASSIFSQFAAPDSIQNAAAASGTGGVRSTHASINLRGQNQINASTFKAPQVFADKPSPQAGDAVIFAAKPAEGDTWNNNNVTVKWTVDGKEIAGEFNADRSASTCSVTTSSAGTLTATAVVNFGDAQASPEGKLSVSVEPHAAPKLSAAYPSGSDGKVTVSVANAPADARYRWTVAGAVDESAEGSALRLAAPTIGTTLVACALLGPGGEPISALGRITLVAHDPSRDDIVLTDDSKDPAEQAPQAGESLTLSVSRAGSAQGSRAIRAAEQVIWTVSRNEERVDPSKYAADGATLTIPVVSNSNYTVTAQFTGENGSNMRAWDFTPAMQPAPSISVDGKSDVTVVPVVAGNVVRLSVGSVPAGATVRWAADGAALKSNDPTVSFMPKGAGTMTIEATVVLDSSPISKTASQTLQVEDVDELAFDSVTGDEPSAPNPSEPPQADPDDKPSAAPSAESSSGPSSNASAAASASASAQPSSVTSPSSAPSETAVPSSEPSAQPSEDLPGPEGSAAPSGAPSSDPSAEPTGGSSAQPSSEPSTDPSGKPSESSPSAHPSSGPASSPSSVPSDAPDAATSASPSGSASAMPSASASAAPSASALPSEPGTATNHPTLLPSRPGYYPSYVPGLYPSHNPGSNTSQPAVPGATTGPSSSVPADPAGSSPASSSASPVPGAPAPNAPLPVALIQGPDSSGPLLVGITMAAPAEERMAGSLGTWVTVPRGGGFDIRTPDGCSIPSWTPLATGQVATVWDGSGKVISEMTLVVAGDLLGAGELSIAQVVRLAHNLTGKLQLTGPFYVAGDMNGNDRLEIADLVALASALTKNKR